RQALSNEHMDGHPLILLKHGGPSRKKASLYGKVAHIYFALSGSFLLCAQQFCTYYGPEFVSTQLLQWAVDEKLETVLIEPGKPWQNGINESFNGKFRDEC